MAAIMKRRARKFTVLGNITCGMHHQIGGVAGSPIVEVTIGRYENANVYKIFLTCEEVEYIYGSMTRDRREFQRDC